MSSRHRPVPELREMVEIKINTHTTALFPEQGKCSLPLFLLEFEFPATYPLEYYPNVMYMDLREKVITCILAGNIRSLVDF